MRVIGLAVVLALGLALAAPVAEAQQTEKIYRVGLLTLGTITPDNLMWSPFLDAMRQLGYMEGRNLVVRRGAAGDGRPERLPGLVSSMLRDGVDVIVTTSTRETQAARQATETLPIVMTLSPDPVEQGLVTSLARPGGNVTGLTNLVPGVSQKYVELLKEIVPSATRFTVVARRAWPQIRRDLEQAAQRLSVRLSFADVEGPDDIARALAQAKKDGAGGIIVPLDVVTRLNREHLARVAVQYQLPSIYWERDYVEAGGLVSYGASLADVGRRAAYFVDRIFKGAKPADLPVEQPTKFDLVINLKTAKALGLTIPQSLLVRADAIIQ
jgi:putative tryptophan/tyrosine transport system substrate-binding protein